VEQLDDQLDVEPPALIRGYLRLGAKVLGPPAWDPDFNTADLPLLMRLDELRRAFAGISCARHEARLRNGRPDVFRGPSSKAYRMGWVPLDRQQ
jgi:putative hemolysin